jgi:hypothetical protein
MGAGVVAAENRGANPAVGIPGLGKENGNRWGNHRASYYGYLVVTVLRAIILFLSLPFALLLGRSGGFASGHDFCDREKQYR